MTVDFSLLPSRFQQLLQSCLESTNFLDLAQKDSSFPRKAAVSMRQLVTLPNCAQCLQHIEELASVDDLLL